MIRVYHTPVTNPSSTDTASTTASTAVTESVICWTCLGLTVSTTGKYMITCYTGKMHGNAIISLYIYGPCIHSYTIKCGSILYRDRHVHIHSPFLITIFTRRN